MVWQQHPFKQSEMDSRISLIHCLKGVTRITFLNRIWLNNRRIFFKVLTAYIIFMIFLQWLCKGMVYSYFYSPPDLNTLYNTAIEQNTKRLELAKSGLSSINRRQNTTVNINMAIVVTTVKRTHPDFELGYLTQTLFSITKALRSSRTDNDFLFICNTYPGPGKHHEAERLKRHFSYIERFPSESPKDVIIDRFEKEKQDYEFCLKAALQYRPNYIFMLEDDVLLKEGALTIFQFILKHRIKNKYERGYSTVNRNPFGYVKLFYPERWSGFSFKLQHLMELYSLLIIGGVFFVSLNSTISKYKLSTPQSTLVNLILFFSGGIFVCLTAGLIGRQHLYSWQNLSRYFHSIAPAPDCCTPAIIFNASFAHILTNYLTNATCSVNNPLDILMSRVTDIEGHDKFIIVPNIVNHIGMYSTIKGRSMHPEDFLL